MTAPNYHGYTESEEKIALRWERMKAEHWVTEYKSQTVNRNPQWFLELEALYQEADALDEQRTIQEASY